MAIWRLAIFRNPVFSVQYLFFQPFFSTRFKTINTGFGSPAPFGCLPQNRIARRGRVSGHAAPSVHLIFFENQVYRRVPFAAVLSFANNNKKQEELWPTKERSSVVGQSESCLNVIISEAKLQLATDL